MRWQTLMGRCPGSSHAESGTPCQDFVAAQACDLGLLVGALADGMGSAPRSQVGAQVAVETAVRVLTPLFPILTIPTPCQVEEAFHLALVSVRNCVLARACAEKAPPEHYESTILAFAANEDYVAAMSIGDSWITARFSDAAGHELLIPPEKGEFENVTFSFLSEDQHLRWTFLKRQPLSVVASSDGLLYLALDERTWKPHAPFFEFLENEVAHAGATNAQIHEFLSLPQVQNLTNDDRSLLCAKWQGNSAKTPLIRSTPSLSLDVYA